MQTFLAKCTAVGIVAGGFALTGDLSRLADRGRSLIDATGVPAERPAREEPTPSQGGGPLAAPTAQQVATSPATNRVVTPTESAPAPQPARGETLWRLPGDAPADAPVGRPAAAAMPKDGGVAAVDLRRLAAGARLLVWLQRPGTPGGSPAVADLIAFDIVDPAGGEALEHRHASVDAAGRGPVHAPPRRVLIVADGNGRLARGEAVRVAPISGVHGTGQREDLGRVMALEVRGP